MSDNSGIEWTQATWNPVTGCTKVSQGCKNCYAERLAHRLKAMGLPQYRNGFELTLQPTMLDVPRRWRRPRVVFVNSMSDLFHKDVPLAYIQSVFKVMNECPRHTFQVLTKRPEIAAAYAPWLCWSDNIWMGTSVENMVVTHRIGSLRAIPARVRFLSVEPLLGPIPSLPLEGIHWVIVGGESGPGARPMEAGWGRDIRDRCLAHGVPFFFKQWGGVNKKATGRVLDGRTWDEMPLGVRCAVPAEEPREGTELRSDVVTPCAPGYGRAYFSTQRHNLMNELGLSTPVGDEPEGVRLEGGSCP